MEEKVKGGWRGEKNGGEGLAMCFGVLH